MKPFQHKLTVGTAKGRKDKGCCRLDRKVNIDSIEGSMPFHLDYSRATLRYLPLNNLE